jgi:Asp-tRNA(Asn)/Glu-tRNA(Gln) amidotransferase A subunit family amidase
MTRDFITRPYDSLIAPRVASAAFRLGEHYNTNPDRWVGYGIAAVFGALATLAALGLLGVPA